MKNLWNDQDITNFQDDLLKLRVYTSRLLGQSDDLVLHGGGNTSVKITQKNIFNQNEEILYVKGSGWDLKTIEEAGFSPTRLEYLKRLAELPTLSDSQMMQELKASQIDPAAPTPSVEAILHAIIPFRFVDHTHADAVVTISNTPSGFEKLQEIYGDEVLILPYKMPGFILTKQILNETKSIDWSKLKGIILLHHGVFTFHQEAQSSYSNMIDLVSKAEEYIANQDAHILAKQPGELIDPLWISQLRQELIKKNQSPLLLKAKLDEFSVGYACLENIDDIGTRGTITPDHVIHTKQKPIIFTKNIQTDLENYQRKYIQYFERNKKTGLTCLNPLPCYGIMPNKGLVVIAESPKKITIISDIVDHTLKAVQKAEKMGGWSPLDEKNLFDLEYWELEQAKLKKLNNTPALQGQIALISGAASGIGKATTLRLAQAGASVIALDINPTVLETFQSPHILPYICDITDPEALQKILSHAVHCFGGIDILINNAGVFPLSSPLEELSQELLKKTFEVNFFGGFNLIQKAIPYLKNGFNPHIINVSSKNVKAPGPGVMPYSASKAATHQMCRVAALELATHQIRVNEVNPDAIFDTQIWTDEILEKRAKHYDMSVEDYKKKNLLKKMLTSKHVADLILTLCSPAYYNSTGMQVSIDGGNERTI